jgi:hypothetical protein
MKFGSYKADILRNVFPRNPTQTSYLRFLEDPSKPIKTLWEKSQSDFEERMKLPDLTKTYYSEMLEEGDDDRHH